MRYTIEGRILLPAVKQNKGKWKRIVFEKQELVWKKTDGSMQHCSMADFILSPREHVMDTKKKWKTLQVSSGAVEQF